MSDLKDLIEERDRINGNITNLLEDEMQMIREFYHGNGHCIQDIRMNTDGSVSLDIWYDDWERSQNVGWRFTPKETL